MCAWHTVNSRNTQQSTVQHREHNTEHTHLLRRHVVRSRSQIDSGVRIDAWQNEKDTWRADSALEKANGHRHRIRIIADVGLLENVLCAACIHMYVCVNATNPVQMADRRTDTLGRDLTCDIQRRISLFAYHFSIFLLVFVYVVVAPARLPRHSAERIRHS